MYSECDEIGDSFLSSHAAAFTTCKSRDEVRNKVRELDPVFAADFSHVVLDNVVERIYLTTRKREQI